MIGSTTSAASVSTLRLVTVFFFLKFFLKSYWPLSGSSRRRAATARRDDVLGFIDELELDRVGLVGHGMGGVVAHLLAQDHADRVERLVLEETPPPFPGGTAARDVRPDEPLDYDWPVVPAITRQLADPDPDWLDGLGEIVAPTLIITGGPDSSVPQDRMPDMAALIPDCRLITIPAGRSIHEEQPRPFAQEITEFLTS